MASKIEWTDETWNPVTGCSKVSQGCKNCYAERIFPRVYAKDQMRVNGKLRPRVFTDVLTHPDRLHIPLGWRRARRIFVNSMSDLFHEDVPFSFVEHVFAVMQRTPQHTYQILTKRPRRMLEFCGCRGWPDGPLPNMWLGVSIEDQTTADERVPILIRTPAAVRFISYEPVLGPLALRRSWLDYQGEGEFDRLPSINWVIAGGESGPNARPAHPDWFRSVRDQCKAWLVPFFFKQWGEWMPSPRNDSVASWYAAGKERLVGAQYMFRAGKKAAGNVLDGRTHEEYPA